MARPILSTELMRTAEAEAIAAGTPDTELMDRAGQALAEAIRLYAGPRRTLVLCGPGNNGGDGYVAARRLASHGYPVRVAALAEPSTEAAQWARRQWGGRVDSLDDATPAPIVIDCLFGTGLKRGLDDAVSPRLYSL